MILLPFFALACAWAFGRNPSVRFGFQVLAACWGSAALMVILILATLPDQITDPMFFLNLLLMRIPYLLAIAGPFLAVAAALLTGTRAPEADERREAVFTAAKTAAGVGGKVAGGLAASFIREAIKEAKKG